MGSGFWRHWWQCVMLRSGDGGVSRCSVQDRVVTRGRKEALLFQTCHLPSWRTSATCRPRPCSCQRAVIRHPPPALCGDVVDRTVASAAIRCSRTCDSTAQNVHVSPFCLTNTCSNLTAQGVGAGTAA
jgi:hypothetical protein